MDFDEQRDFDNPLRFPSLQLHVWKPEAFNLRMLEEALGTKKHRADSSSMEDPKKPRFYWSLESLFFFSLKDDQQRDAVRAIVKGAWEAAQQARHGS